MVVNIVLTCAVGLLLIIYVRVAMKAIHAAHSNRHAYPLQREVLVMCAWPVICVLRWYFDLADEIRIWKGFLRIRADFRKEFGHRPEKVDQSVVDRRLTELAGAWYYASKNPEMDSEVRLEGFTHAQSLARAFGFEGKTIFFYISKDDPENSE
jgi:hypothetical protein